MWKSLTNESKKFTQNVEFFCDHKSIVEKLKKSRKEYKYLSAICKSFKNKGNDQLINADELDDLLNRCNEC